jgi:type III pantothenate kinase
MPVLAVDVGNTRIKWGLWDGRWVQQNALPTADVHQLGATWQGLPQLRRVIACSVAGGQVGDWLDAWALAHGLSVHWVTSLHEQCGVRNLYQDPSKLGADRWAALIAARALVTGAALAVVAGTTVTVNALSHDGEFLGGLILPGLDMMADALARGTAGLPRAYGQFAPFPQNTADAIASGAIQSVCGAIERMRDELAARGAEPQILLSGGAAEIFNAHLRHPSLIVPNLVLEGLRVIADGEAAR